VAALSENVDARVGNGLADEHRLGLAYLSYHAALPWLRWDRTRCRRPIWGLMALSTPTCRGRKGLSAHNGPLESRALQGEPLQQVEVGRGKLD
jgi:hypothetical protein